VAVVDTSTSAYDAEFGRSGEAVINLTLRSGANNFHGSLFEYHKDAAVQAPDFSKKPLCESKRPTS
jgi:hypothetical protein